MAERDAEASRGRPLQLATPVSETLPNGLTLILNERAVCRSSRPTRARTGGDTNPLDCPGSPTSPRRCWTRTATRNALQIADEVAHLNVNSASAALWTHHSPRSLSKNLGATVSLLADVTLRTFPAQEIERQRASRLASRCSSGQPESGGGAGHGVCAYGRSTRHYSEIGTEALEPVAPTWRRSGSRTVPNNAALVAGDVSMAELKALAEKAFGLAEGHSGAARARHTRHDTGSCGDRGQAGQPADTASRCQHRRATVLA